MVPETSTTTAELALGAATGLLPVVGVFEAVGAWGTTTVQDVQVELAV